MARVNVYLPDELHLRAKRARLSVSEICQRAVETELQRRQRLRALARFTDDLEERQGPASATEVADAEAWVDTVIAAAEGTREPVAPTPARRRRTG